MKNEVREENAFVKRVTDKGWDAIKLATQGSYGRRGRNDRLILAGPPAVVALFEFKAEGEEARPLQAYMHRRYKRMEFPCYVVYSCGEAWDILASLIKEAKKKEARLRS